ncbi:unnamed protein product, partial [Iphiclides podalirius]
MYLSFQESTQHSLTAKRSLLTRDESLTVQFVSRVVRGQTLQPSVVCNKTAAALIREQTAYATGPPLAAVEPQKPPLWGSQCPPITVQAGPAANTPITAVAERPRLVSDTRSSFGAPTRRDLSPAARSELRPDYGPRLEYKRE